VPGPVVVILPNDVAGAISLLVVLACGAKRAPGLCFPARLALLLYGGGNKKCFDSSNELRARDDVMRASI
jgi:hypothetical protein